MRPLALCSLALALLAACHSTDRRGVRVNEGDDGPRVVERAYARPADEVCDAAVAVAKKMELRIDDDRHDKLGGTIVARRANGDRIVFRVQATDEHRSRLKIEVDPNNGTLAAKLHDAIAAKLGLAQAKSAAFGGNTAKGTYACTLSRAASASEAVLARLSLQVTRIDVRDDTATFDAREYDSVPVRIHLDKDGSKVDAVFTVGTSSDPESKNRVRRLKSEFERELTPPLEE